MMVKQESNKTSMIFSGFNRFTDVLAGISSVAIFIVVVWQVFGRLLGVPAPWTEEVTRFIFIWMVFLGVGLGFRKAESARVTILLQYGPEFLRKGAVWIYSLASIGFFLFMIVYGVELMSQQINTHEKSAALLLPMWIIGLSIPASAVIGIVNIIHSLLNNREIIGKG
jgi:C4-dicarboxylate transporter, DctQ subunit